jgi:uncharacterized protein (TIGR02284 family)
MNYKLVMNGALVLLISFTFPVPSFSNNHLAQHQGPHTKNTEEIAKKLQTLTQYEIDGSFLIEQAIASISNPVLKERLLAIKEECEVNIKELSDLIRQYGREAPAHSRDFKGFFMQGYVGMRGLISDQGAMRALYTNLQMMLKAFEESLKSNLPADVKQKLSKIYEKGKKHLEYISTQM